MLFRFFKKPTPTPTPASQRRKLGLQVEALENRDAMSASNPVAGVSWTKEIYFHGHFDGAAAHMPKASDFKVEIQWGDGEKTVAKDIVELQPHSDNFKVTAHHTYAKPGNTKSNYEVDITNLRDSKYKWVQEGHGITVDKGPLGSPSNPLTGNAAAGSPRSTPVVTPPATLDMRNPLNWFTPAAGAANEQPEQAPVYLQGRVTGSGHIGGSSAVGALAAYPSAYSQPQKPVTGHTPAPAHPPVHKVTVTATPSHPPLHKGTPIAAPTKPLVGAALKNPSPLKDFTLTDPVQLRHNWTTTPGDLDNMRKLLKAKDKSVNWDRWIDTEFKPRVQRAVDAAAAALPAEYQMKALQAHSTISFKSKDRVTITIQKPTDQHKGPELQKALTKWVELLNLELKKAGLQ